MEIQDQPISALDWLKDRLRKQAEEEVDPTWELEELLKRMDKPTEKKAPQKFSKVVRDECRSRTLHIAEPVADKDRNEITPEDYVIKQVDLGCAFAM